MGKSNLKIIVSDCILPITSEPIFDCALVVDGFRVVDFGFYKQMKKIYSSASVLDYSGFLIMPGLVNAHSHIELSALKGRVTEFSSFTQWILKLVELKKGLSYDFIFDSVNRAILDLWNCGTVAIGDVSSEYISQFSLFDNNLYSRVFFEYIPLKDINIDNSFNLICDLLNGFTIPKDFYEYNFLTKLFSDFDFAKYRNYLSISPHSTYTLSSKAFRKILPYARDNSIQCAIHVGESIDEYNMFFYGKGELFDLMSCFWDCRDIKNYTPLSYLYENDFLIDNMLLVHLNIFRDSEISILQELNLSVCHCPFSHRFFSHPGFDLIKLLDNGVNVAIGTDSLASNFDFNLFKEMKIIKQNFPGIASYDIVRMATINGARALKLPFGIGQIVKGAFYSLIALDMDSYFGDIYDFIVFFNKSPLHVF